MMVLAGMGQSVENMEAAGARELQMSDLLPTDMGDRKPYEEMGIVFGEINPKDPLFTFATIPQGWKKISDKNDPRHMHLVDETGKKRVYIFYKAASYDRTASMSPCRD
jgi:hypothetical protein